MATRWCLLVALAALAAQTTSAYERPVPFASFHALQRPAASRSARSVSNVRIANGHEAGEKQFPHQVGIYVDMRAFCGGALVSPRWVLTAATCAGSNPRARYTAFLGAHNINLPAERHRLAVTTTQSYVPATFDAATFKDDVGLIMLPRDVPVSDYIKPINLPSPDVYADQTFVGDKFQLSGWGYVKDGAATISPTLQYTDLQGVDKKTCVQTYSYEIYSDAILCCIGANKQSPCQGDTGGALVKTEADGSQTIIALASFTPASSCTAGKPAGFTKITPYIDWIASIVDA